MSKEPARAEASRFAESLSAKLLAERECPDDLVEWGRRHGIPEFARVTWQAGFLAGMRMVAAQWLAERLENPREPNATASGGGLMPRRCHCARLLAMLERDALRLAGLAAQAVLLRLMTRAHELGSDGFLPVGSGSVSGIGNLTELSQVLTVSETDLQTQIETLVARGVLVVEPGGIACPEIRDGARKVAAARQNGAAGGRPRRGETPAEARARRQGSLMLPIEGGKPTGTETGTHGETPSRARADDDSSSSTQSNHHPSQDAAREATELARLGAEVMEAAGLDQARYLGSYEPVREWRAMGLSRERILEVIAAVKARAKQRPRGLGFFGEEMRRAAAAGVEAEAAAERAAKFAALNRAWDAWEAAGRRGAPPSREAFGLPAQERAA